MPLHDFGADEQPKPGAGNPFRALRAVAALKHASSLLFWNTDAVIAHGDASETGGSFEPHFDIAAVWRVFDRVADQILKHPLHPALVVHRHNGGSRRQTPEAVNAHDAFHLFDGHFQRSAQIMALQIQLQRIPFQRAKIDEQIDQL